MNEQLNDYILNHIDAEPEHLYRLERDTHLRLLYSRMCSGHLQGRMLKMFVRMICPQRILELGTFTGYSALCLAEGLADDSCEVHTIEIDDELEDFIKSHFALSPLANRITLHIGDAREVLATINGDFDLVFIDANKREYPDYYGLALTLTRSGGFIVADDVLWDGKVYAENVPGDRQTQGIVRFNDITAGDKRVETVILPVRHGLSIVRKK